MKRIMNGNGNGEWSIVGSGYFKAFERLAAIEDILGDDYDLDRLRELAQADRDGRCWVFPCKVDDDVYINFWGRTLQATISSISQVANTPNFRAMIGGQLCYIFKTDDFGKSVFLTREEAEAKLKERENNG